jgi:hypothetical protein
MSINTLYKQAPDLLLEKIAEVNAVLVKANKGSENYKFWKRVADVMKHSWHYMNDFMWVLRENESLKAENRFLKEWCRELSERLQPYETIKSEKLAGTFDEVVKQVDEYLENGSK